LPALSRCRFGVCWSTMRGCRKFVHFIVVGQVHAALMWADLWKRIGGHTASL
jgi:hypothetical protein